MVSIAFPRTIRPVPSSVLAADVGGTKTNLALYQRIDNGIKLIRTASYVTANHPSFENIVNTFLQTNEQIRSLCVGFAGPVINNVALGTNLPWGIDGHAVSKTFGIDHVFIINDLEANAYGLAALSPDELFVLNKGYESLKGNAAIISPGTGLGEAGLYWDGTSLHPFATEGGHCDFYPREDIDVELFNYLKKTYKRISWERLLSGSGIHTIFNFMTEVKQLSVPDWMMERMQSKDPAQVISEAAEKGEKIALETYHLFLRYLAEEAANLTLKIKATGGLFIGGGIVPKILPLLNTQEFLSDYLHCGRMNSLLEKVPVYVILNDKTAMLGAAYFGLNA